MSAIVYDSTSNLYSVATDRGKVRLLIHDRSVNEHVLEEADIDAFLGLTGGSVLLAAALALDAIAVSEVLVQKRIKLLDLSTDGPAEAAELRALATSYRAQATAATAGGGGTTAADRPFMFGTVGGRRGA